MARIGLVAHDDKKDELVAWSLKNRDKLMLRQMVMMPFIQLLLLSSAATFEVKTAHIYLVDRDHSETSRGLVAAAGARVGFAVPLGAAFEARLQAEGLAALTRHTLRIAGTDAFAAMAQ